MHVPTERGSSPGKGPPLLSISGRTSGPHHHKLPPSGKGGCPGQEGQYIPPTPAAHPWDPKGIMGLRRLALEAPGFGGSSESLQDDTTMPS